MEEHEYDSVAQMKGAMSHTVGGRAGGVRAGELHEGADPV